MTEKTKNKLKNNIRYPKTEEMQVEACRTLLKEALSDGDLLWLYYFGDDFSKVKAWERLKVLRANKSKAEWEK